MCETLAKSTPPKESHDAGTSSAPGANASEVPASPQVGNVYVLPSLRRAPLLQVVCNSSNYRLERVSCKKQEEHIAEADKDDTNHTGQGLSFNFNLKTRIPAILPHYPIGTSYQNLRHFQQVYRAKKFVMYDYGYTENMKRYGQVKPPAYPLERISIPVALFSSNGDTLADRSDVADRVQRLGSRILFNKVLPQADFRHVYFIFGYGATSFLHQPMIDTLNSSAEE